MSDAATIRENIEKIEEAYEFMLAYAAQGRMEEGAQGDGLHIRTFLERFARSSGELLDQTADLLNECNSQKGGLLSSFQQDSATINSVLALLLKQPNISSEMVDNTNGLIAMRSYLTTLFFIDKAVLTDNK